MKLSKPSEYNLPVIECGCGAQILVIPNVELMGKAIEAHVREHKEKAKGRREAEAEAERVREDLIEKVFSKVCEI
ncbi:MAG: hypothetical protein ACQCN6_08230 [Candidatus Bathyarchaeia archaeon]